MMAIPLLFAVIIIAGCAPAHPKSTGPLSTIPDNSVATGYINGYSFNIPKNWVTSSSSSVQQTHLQTVFAYGQDARLTMQEFPSFLDSASSSNPITATQAEPQLNIGMTAYASLLGMTVAGPPSVTTIMKQTALIYTLTQSGAKVGEVSLVFTGQSELIASCIWTPSYQAVGSSGCNDAISTLTISQQLGSIGF